jgi:hypothetical protein
VVVRELTETRHLWTPDDNPRQVHTHRGVVLALGEPGQQEFLVDGRSVLRDVPWGFGIGSVVQYHFEHNQAAFTREWEDGKPATWLPQRCVDGVIE